MLGKVAFGTAYLAAAAQTASATDGIDIDAEAPRRLEYFRTEREAAAATGWREYDFGVFAWQWIRAC